MDSTKSNPSKSDPTEFSDELRQECIQAHQDRLVRQGYPLTAARIPALYASLPASKARLLVDLYRGIEDGDRRSYAATMAHKTGESIRRFLTKESPLSPMGLTLHMPPLHEQRAWTPPRKRDLPQMLRTLPAWEAEFLLRMVHTPSYFTLVLTQHMWHVGRLWTPGSPLLSRAHRLSAYARPSSAERVLVKLSAKALSRPATLLLTFEQCRQAYNPSTRRVEINASTTSMHGD